MKVQVKLTLLLVLLVNALFGSLLLMRHMQYRKMALLLEQHQRENQEILGKLIELRGKSLLALCSDYTYWDEMVEFVKTADPTWARTKIDTALPTYDAHIAWVYRPDQTLVHVATRLKDYPEREIPLREEVWKDVFAAGPLAHFFVDTPFGLLEIRGGTIHPSADVERKSRALGYFFVGRLWNREYLAELSKLLGGPVKMLRPTDAGKGPAPAGRGDTVTLNRELMGWDQKPLALLNVEFPTPLHRAFVRASNMDFLLYAAFAIVFLALFVSFIIHWVAVPLGRISATLKTENVALVASMQNDRTEFGTIARLISQFFQQKEKILTEITERRIAEKLRRESEEFLRATLEATADGILVVDENGKVRVCNARFVDMWRIPQEIVKTRDDEKLLQAVVDQLKDPGTFLSKVRQLYGTLAEDLDQIPFKDGRVFERFSCPLARDGRIVGRAWSFRDITPHKLEEEARRESEERYRATINAVSDALHVVGRDLRIILCNETLRTWVKQYVGNVDPVHQEVFALFTFLPDNVRAEYDHVFRTGEAMLTEESQAVGKDQMYTETRKFPVFDSEGRVCYVVTIIRDITARTRVEEQRAKLEDQLRLVQKTESIGRLAGGIAHDFNNLLTPILGYSQMVLMKARAGDPIRADLEQIENAAKRAKDLTSKLLALGRRQIMEMKVVNLTEVVSELVKMLRRTIGEDIEIVTALDPELANVRADPSQVEQIVLNLAVNARDAMPNGGTLTVRTANALLDEAYAATHAGVRAGPHVLLSVSDTGSGMDADTLGHLFEPFFTTKERGKGTGLGLATIHGIVNQHGGSIWVTSRVGEGTTFEIYLPRVDEARRPDAAVAPGAAGRKGSETVLIVEDEDTVRSLARDILKEHGYRTLDAGMPEEAIRLAREYGASIHLLLTDVIMPQMNGKDLYTRLVAQRPGMRVLYMSGYPENVIANHDIIDPEVNFLRKPFTPSSLAQKVREVLDR